MDLYGSGTKYDESSEMFLFREPIVLFPIICLSVLNGIANQVNLMRFITFYQTGVAGTHQYFSIVQSFGPFPAMILMTFLSEIRGRKPVFIMLFTLSVLYSILHFTPVQQPWTMIENFVAASLNGGVIAITALAICEYCNPKHRFGCLVAHGVAVTVGTRVASILFTPEDLSGGSTSLSSCELVVGLACLVSVWWWPESPYWLAARGRHAEARAALLRLRGEGAVARRELRALQASSRRPSPKLFWLALLIALISISVADFSMAINQLLFRLNRGTSFVVNQTLDHIIYACSSLLVSLIMVLISYKVKRKVLYVGASGVSFLLLYILSIWLYSEQAANYYVFYMAVQICSILLQCGPINLSIALLMEYTPHKYYTYVSAISSMVFRFSAGLVIFVSLIFYDRFPLYGFIIILTTLALPGLGMLYWLSPETRNRNLFDIEKSYMLRLYGENPEQDQVVLEDRVD